MKWTKSISFTYNWIDTLKIAFASATLVIIILVFLQPFDTYQTVVPYKTIKLSGYGLTIFLPYLLLHFAEQLIYRKNEQNWTIILELAYVLSLIALITLCAFVYHNLIFTRTSLNIQLLDDFFLVFTFPFILILLPFVIYLRQKFGVFQEAKVQTESILFIKGNNQEDLINFKRDDFLFAKADQNYMELYLLNSKKEVEKKLIRCTLYHLQAQLPFAKQVHRSYLINANYLKSIGGNSRKRTIKMNFSEEDIPLSNTYYKDLIQTRPSNS